MDENPDTGPDLELEVGSGVPVELRHVVSASATFASLLNEVAESYAGAPKPVKWYVEVHPGSVRLPIRAEPAKATVTPSAIKQIPPLIGEGIERLAREAVRPDYFSDKALQQLKALANLASDDLPLSVLNGHGRIPLTAQLVANADKVLGAPRASIGTVEGRLDALNIHGSKELSIWQEDGSKVRCFFGGHLDLERDVLPAVGKRVAARGEIKSRPTGERLSVTVRRLRVIGADTASADEVRGILRGYESEDAGGTATGTPARSWGGSERNRTRSTNARRSFAKRRRESSRSSRPRSRSPRFCGSRASSRSHKPTESACGSSSRTNTSCFTNSIAPPPRRRRTFSGSTVSGRRTPSTSPQR